MLRPSTRHDLQIPYVHSIEIIYELPIHSLLHERSFLQTRFPTFFPSEAFLLPTWSKIWPAPQLPKRFYTADRKLNFLVTPFTFYYKLSAINQ